MPKFTRPKEWMNEKMELFFVAGSSIMLVGLLESLRLVPTPLTG